MVMGDGGWRKEDGRREEYKGMKIGEGDGGGWGMEEEMEVEVWREGDGRGYG